jgi:micrococcal nuclease
MTVVASRHVDARSWIPALLAAALAVACAGDDEGAGGAAPLGSPPGEPARCALPYPATVVEPRDALCADPASMERAAVVRIVDGDTLRVLVRGREEPVRLFGVDAPERGETCAGAATARLRTLAGENVFLRPDARDRDRFDRLLRYVYAEDGLNIDAQLVVDGLARAWTADGALRDALVALEDSARAGRAGCLWGD